LVVDKTLQTGEPDKAMDENILRKLSKRNPQIDPCTEARIALDTVNVTTDATYTPTIFDTIDNDIVVVAVAVVVLVCVVRMFERAAVDIILPFKSFFLIFF
jgi:hypothetical protein